MNSVYHIPVLLKQSVDGMSIKSDSICVDVTFGGGGHSREILTRLGREGHLYGFDQDRDAIGNIKEDSRFTFVLGNFRYLKNFLHYYNVEQVDSVLADLGVSSHHFDAPERGFSFRFENDLLDMRMNTLARRTAADVLNTYSEEKLADIFYYYGELKAARGIATAVVKRRADAPYKTIGDLLGTLTVFTKREKEKKMLAQAFQALRIEVNQEMDSLKEMLLQAQEVLKPGGRLVVITYHSLEDRLVKNFLKTGNFEGRQDKDFFGNINSPFNPVNNKVIAPSVEEESLNPRSRSAKLRIAEKK